jgi:hypothetical protein
MNLVINTIPLPVSQNGDREYPSLQKFNSYPIAPFPQISPRSASNAYKP